MLDAVREYFEARLAEHGETSAGVDWKDERSHELRHRQFLRLLERSPEASVIDLGCGYGDFAAFLRAHGHLGTYLGLDVSPSMVSAASRRHVEDSKASFEVGSEPVRTADYAVASGIFNLTRGADGKAWDRYIQTTINTLARCSRVGFGFNMLSLSSDPERRRAELRYADPPSVLSDMLAHHGRHVALLQDYGLWEFTVLVRHDHAPGER